MPAVFCKIRVLMQTAKNYAWIQHDLERGKVVWSSGSRQKRTLTSKISKRCWSWEIDVIYAWMKKLNQTYKTQPPRKLLPLRGLDKNIAVWGSGRMVSWFLIWRLAWLGGWFIEKIPCLHWPWVQQEGTDQHRRVEWWSNLWKALLPPPTCRVFRSGPRTRRWWGPLRVHCSKWEVLGTPCGVGPQRKKRAQHHQVLLRRPRHCCPLRHQSSPGKKQYTQLVGMLLTENKIHYGWGGSQLT